MPPSWLISWGQKRLGMWLCMYIYCGDLIWFAHSLLINTWNYMYNFNFFSGPIATYPTVLPQYYTIMGKQLPLIQYVSTILAFESGSYTCGVNFMTCAGEWRPVPLYCSWLVHSNWKSYKHREGPWGAINTKFSYVRRWLAWVSL